MARSVIARALGRVALVVSTLCGITLVTFVLVHLAPGDPASLRAGEGRGVTAEVIAFLAERIAVARGAGMRSEQLIVDPGPDFAKTPAQTIRLLAQVGRLHELGRPLLMAISRKDFLGALTGRRPRERLAGTLAAQQGSRSTGAYTVDVNGNRVESAGSGRVRAQIRRRHPI